MPPGKTGDRRALRGKLGRNVEQSLGNADQVTKHKVDSDSAAEVKEAASS